VQDRNAQKMNNNGKIYKLQVMSNEKSQASAVSFIANFSTIKSTT